MKGDELYIRDRKALTQGLSRLVGAKLHVGQRRGRLLQALQASAATDDDEAHAVVAGQGLHRADDGLELVGAADVSGGAAGEVIAESPVTAQRTRFAGDGVQRLAGLVVPDLSV